MKITDFLNPKAVSVDLKAKNKSDVIKELLDLLVASGDLKEKDRSSILATLMERESLGSTGIGQGVGIPHSKTSKVEKIVGAFGVSKEGVDFSSLDGNPTNIFFLLLAPQEMAGPHLKALARISRLLKDEFFRDKLRQTATSDEALERIALEDKSVP